MGFGMPMTGRLMAHGIPAGLGVDVITSTAGDLFTQMRTTLQIERALALQEGATPSRSIIQTRAIASTNEHRAFFLMKPFKFWMK